MLDHHGLLHTRGLICNLGLVQRVIGIDGDLLVARASLRVMMTGRGGTRILIRHHTTAANAARRRLGLHEHLTRAHLLLEDGNVILFVHRLSDDRVLAALSHASEALVEPIANGLLGDLFLDLVFKLLARQQLFELERLAYVYGSIREHVEHVVEAHVATVVRALDLVAHVLEEQAVLFEVHFEAASQQAQQEFDASARYEAFAIRVHYVPDYLKVAYVAMTKNFSKVFNFKVKMREEIEIRLYLRPYSHLSIWTFLVNMVHIQKAKMRTSKNSKIKFYRDSKDFTNRPPIFLKNNGFVQHVQLSHKILKLRQNST